MAAGIYNIHIEQGATFERVFTVKNPDGTLANYSGFTGRMHIRRDTGNNDTLEVLTTENGKMELGGALGTVKITLTAAETSALTRGGVYDLELIEGGTGRVERLVQGKVILDREVTR